jgi:hypothetical protein
MRPGRDQPPSTIAQVGRFRNLLAPLGGANKPSKEEWENGGPY